MVSMQKEFNEFVQKEKEIYEKVSKKGKRKFGERYIQVM